MRASQVVQRAVLACALITVVGCQSAQESPGLKSVPPATLSASLAIASAPATAAPAPATAAPSSTATASASASVSAAGPMLGGVPMTECNSPNLGYRRYCGYVTVPVDRRQAGGPTLDVHVALVPSLMGDSSATPLFALAGGPGGAGTVDLAWVPTVYGTIHNERDIVFIDQRGTGDSGPLDLPPAPDVSGLSDAEASAQISSWASAALASAPVDYTTYTSSVAADDVDAVREALGVDKIDLLGPSYGGTLAQYYLRQHADHVERAVLDGATPLDVPIFELIAPNSQAALDRLLLRCTEDQACRAAFPNIQDEWRSLSHELRKPVDTGLVDPDSGQPLLITMDDLAPGIHSALLHSGSAANLPFLIHLAAQGQWQAVKDATGSSVGSNASEPVMKDEILCSEAWARFEPDAVEANGAGSYATGWELASANSRAITCAPFTNGVVPANDGAPVVADLPILWVAGDADPQDPPNNLQGVAETQPNAFILSVPAQNHTVSHLGCVPEVVADYLSLPDPNEIDTSCVAQMQAVPAFRTK